MTIVRKGTPSWRIHPGEVLREEFMKPVEITIYRLAKSLHVADPTVRNVVHEKAAVTPEMATRLAKFFGTTEQFWLSLQDAYEVNRIKAEKKTELDRILPLAQATGASER
jgi:addiction module HigA family antidote